MEPGDSARALQSPRVLRRQYTHLGSVDVLFIVDGDPVAAPSISNDLCLSSDAAKTWKPLNRCVPFKSRKDAELTISNDGVMIVSDDDDLGNGNHQDLWASLSVFLSFPLSLFKLPSLFFLSFPLLFFHLDRVLISFFPCLYCSCSSDLQGWRLHLGRLLSQLRL